MTWAVPNDMKTGRSTLFGPLLNVMLQQLESKIDGDGTYNSLEEYLQALRTGSLIILGQFFEAMDLGSIGEYIEEFVTGFSLD